VVARGSGLRRWNRTRERVIIIIIIIIIIGRPSVKRFALCYQTVILFVISVTLVYCGQTVGWIKMSLDTEVGLGPGDVVLDGDPAPHFAIDRPSQLLLSMCFIITLIRMFIDMKAQSA